ncbi:MAG: FmdB family transcriptional regulator [Candidatus Brocadia sp. WS118]|nr:MAG: FmdB family transcriptional regulator [Candidatus Brocadia sp. WS118]
MPTYDYRCNACSHSFELFQHIKENPVKKCPACGKLKAVRVIGAGGAVIFKGSGFYQTDYRSDEYKSKAKKETEPAKTAKPEKSETKTTEKK